jgi:hypothetical protein
MAVVPTPGIRRILIIQLKGLICSTNKACDVRYTVCLHVTFIMSYSTLIKNKFIMFLLIKSRSIMSV